MDASTQSTLFKSIGGQGAVRLIATGNSGSLTGDFMAIKPLLDTTILSGTIGNIGGIENAVIIQGDVLVGQWSIIVASGDFIAYRN